MSEHDMLPGLWPIKGEGVLARQGNLVLLIHPAGGAFTDRLLDLLGTAARAGSGGRRFADLISAEFDSDALAAGTAGRAPSPAVVAFGPDGDGTAITLYGTAWAEISTTHGVQRLTAGEPYGRLRCLLPSRAIQVRAGVNAGDGAGSTDPYLRLADGIVRAVALVYASEVPAAADGGPRDQEASEIAAAVDTGPGEQVAAHADGRLPDLRGVQDFISVPLIGPRADDDVPRRKPLPLGAETPDQKDLGIAGRLPPVIMGVYCKNGHFDDPAARYCAVCGIGMAQLTKVPKEGKRPPLGVLVLDDGSVFQLDTDYVIGREPSLDASVADGSARPLRLTEASGLVSRIHARVELEGWQVYVCDLNSANGTHIILPGEKEGRRLVPGTRTPLVLGAQIRLGNDNGFRYDSHRHR